jgi:hypothetical protein
MVEWCLGTETKQPGDESDCAPGISPDSPGHCDKNSIEPVAVPGMLKLLFPSLFHAQLGRPIYSAHLFPTKTPRLDEKAEEAAAH